MKIKLISPKMTLRPMDSKFKRLMSPSLSLVVAGLTPPEHDVTIADENLGPLDLNDRPDWVGINVNVDHFNLGYRKYGKIATLLVSHLGLMHVYGRIARHLAYGI